MHKDQDPRNHLGSRDLEAREHALLQAPEGLGARLREELLDLRQDLGPQCVEDRAGKMTPLAMILRDKERMADILKKLHSRVLRGLVVDIQAIGWARELFLWKAVTSVGHPSARTPQAPTLRDCAPEGVNGCECKCCEVKQYLATGTNFATIPPFVNVTNAGHPRDDLNSQVGPTGTKNLHKEGTYSFNPDWNLDIASPTRPRLGLFEGFQQRKNSWLGFDGSGNVVAEEINASFIEDVLVLKKNPISGRFMNPDVYRNFVQPWAAQGLEPRDFENNPERVLRAASSGRAGANVKAGRCSLQYTDYPACNLRTGGAKDLTQIQGACNIFIVVVIGPTAECGGNTLTGALSLHHAFQRRDGPTCSKSKTTHKKKSSNFSMMSGTHIFDKGG